MSMITRVKQKQIAQLIAKGKRLDGRDMTEYREIEIEQGIIEHGWDKNRNRRAFLRHAE
jgi:exosome complex RNA-binding protein Rrp42 (RNase PH superfamily)